MLQMVPHTAVWRRRSGLCAAALSALLLCSSGARADDSARPQPQNALPKTAQLTTSSETAISGTGTAARYRPDAFLTLDLSKAALSPIPLGPQARFEPFSIEAKTDTLPTTTRDMARAASKTLAGTTTQTATKETSDPTPASDIASSRTVASPKAGVSQRTASRPASTRTAASAHARTRQAAVRRHSNPLDAQASEPRSQPRVQTWPCRSGGICGWSK